MEDCIVIIHGMVVHHRRRQRRRLRPDETIIIIDEVGGTIMETILEWRSLIGKTGRVIF
jgi:hypothetical protein